MSYTEVMTQAVKSARVIYVQVHSVSRSGMQRRMSFHVVHNGELIRIDRLIADLTGYKLSSKREGLVVRGCGMDMGFAVLCDLFRALGATETFQVTRHEYL